MCGLSWRAECGRLTTYGGWVAGSGFEWGLRGGSTMFWRTGLPSKPDNHGQTSPALRALFINDWVRALFIHFEVSPAVLQAQVPFPLDKWRGHAFVSVVAFTMTRLRPAWGGRVTAWLVSPISEHEFLNVRTYVRCRG